MAGDPAPLRLLSLVALVLGIAVATSACGNEFASPAAAEVNGKTISQNALDDELEAIRGNRDYVAFLESQNNRVTGSGTDTFDGDFVRRVLTRQIYLELVHQEFERQKLKVTDQDIQLVRNDVSQEVGGPEILKKFPKSYQDTLLRRSAEVAALQLKLSDVKVDADAIRKYYDDNPTLFVETCVRHILFAVIDGNGQVATEQTEAQAGDLLNQANAAKARLDAGEDFAKLAAELSKDPSNKDDGGNLDCGPAGRFVPEFETAMDALQPGQVSQPVKTQFGYHIIKVDSRQPKKFEEVQGEIQDRLMGEASQGFGTFLSGAISDAEVTVNPRFGSFSKNLQSPGVLPPNTPTTLPVGVSGSSNSQAPLDLGG